MTRAHPIITGLAAATAAIASAGIGCFLLAVIAARRLVVPRPRPTLSVVACDEASLTVTATPQTLHPGTFAVQDQHGDNHTVIGDIVRHDPVSRTVQRRIAQRGARAFRPEECVVWTSHVIPGPEALSPSWRTVQLQSPGHVCPAWLIPGSPQTTRWAIHIHGINTTRITALRTVPATQRAGMTSLVVSYRGDGEADNLPAQPSGLGTTEWQDIDAAVEYATSHGASHITIVAWSMGAEIALNYLKHGTHSGVVTHMILIAPVIDWRAVITNGLHHAHLPATLPVRAATRLLATRGLVCLTGARAPIDLDALDWTRTKLPVPTLIIHSRDDTQIPIDTSRRLARTNSDTVSLVEWDGADHALEYNTDPRRFNDAINTWSGAV